jgi:hypothetical protein
LGVTESRGSQNLKAYACQARIAARQNNFRKLDSGSSVSQWQPAPSLSKVVNQIPSFGSPFTIFIVSRLTVMTRRKSSGGIAHRFGGPKVGVVHDAVGYTLLTRDKGRYQTYFPTVPLISP